MNFYILVCVLWILPYICYGNKEDYYTKREKGLFEWQVDITYKNKQNEVKKSSNSPLQNPIVLLKDDKYMFVSTKERVHRVDLNDIKAPLLVLYWSPDSICTIKNPFLCENRVQTSIQLNQTHYVFCGIKNTKQICEIYTIKEKVERPPFEIDAKKLVSNTELPLMQPYVSNKTVYYANGNENSRIWFYNLEANAVYIQSDGRPNKRTFLNSFVFEKKVYYFYRECNDETKACVSYISDFCKDEKGHIFNTERFMGTFKMGLLKCIYNDTHGNNRTYDHLEYITKPIKSSIYSFQNETDKYLLFASFSSIEDNHNTSVLCIFDMNEVIGQINNNVYEKDSNFHSEDNCDGEMKFKDFQGKFQDSRYQLNYSITSLAIYRTYSTLITSIDVDKTNFSEVIYVGYSNGRLSKLTSNRSDNKIIKTTVIQDYYIFSNSTITSLTALDNKLITLNNLGINSFISTDCEQYETCKDCVESQDPDCSWVASDRMCKFKVNGIKSVVNGFSHQCKIEDAKNEKTYFKIILLPIFACFLLFSLIGIFSTVACIRRASTQNEGNTDEEEGAPLNS